MTETPSRSPEPTGPLQAVAGSRVGRDLIQIAHVTGNVTITQAAAFGPGEEPGQVVVGDIPAPPPGFQLREELLERLHAQAGVGGAAVVSAVTGTLGVGKTLLAASYAWACQRAGWPVVAWVGAENADLIITGLAALAQRLGLRGADDDAATAAGKARAWLSARSAGGRPGLVVFDNAAEVEDVAAWCPATGAVRVLITSRNRAFHQRYPAVEVDTFTPEQAIRFLAERTGLHDPQEAGELARELGYLPLALAHAAALISRRRITYAAYRRLLAAFPLADHLPRPQGDPYPAGTAQSILLSVDQAEQTIPEAKDALRVLAVLSPAGIPRILLYGGADPDGPEPSPDDLAVASRVQELLAALADTSLIGFSEDGSTVLMHRLVQRVLRERAAHDGTLPAAIGRAISLLWMFKRRALKDRRTWAARAAVEILVEQTDALYTLTATEPSEPLLTLRAWCGRYLTDLADLTRAIPLLERTLADGERVLGEDHPETAIWRNNLANAYQSAGHVRRAIPLFERALAESERVLGDDHPDTSTSRSNLATAYRKAGDLRRATPLLERVLADRERVLGAEHPDTLQSRNNLARAYQTAGDLRRASSLFERALADCERALGDDHPDTLTTRNNLAGTYLMAGDVERAIPLFERNLADCERVLGDDHPDTLQTRNNLGGAYLWAGDLHRAMRLFKRALADRERVLGDDHPGTFESRNNLARVYHLAGNLKRAIPLFERNLADSERALGGDHPDTLNYRNNLAGAYEVAGNLDRAIPLFERTLADRERVLGDDHPDTLHSRHNLAGAYEVAGDLGRAIPLFERTLADCERVLGDDHPLTRKVRSNLNSLRR